MIIGIIFFGMIGAAGLFISISHFTKNFYGIEVKAEIIAFEESFDWNHSGEDANTDNRVWYRPILKYEIEGKMYESKPEISLAWDEPDFNKTVVVFYDPNKPEKVYVKDNTPVAGCFLFFIAVVAIVIILIVNRH